MAGVLRCTSSPPHEHRRRHRRGRPLRGRGAAPPARRRAARAAGIAARPERAFKSLALTHAEGKRWLLVGLGAREQLRPPSALAWPPRVARDARASSPRAALCWQAPADSGDEIAARARRGHAARRLPLRALQVGPAEDASRDAGPSGSSGLIVSRRRATERPSPRPRSSPSAVNAARDLQNRPANDLTPTALAEHAQALGEEIDGLTVEVEGRDGHHGARHGRLRRRRPGLRAGAGADHPALRAARRRPGRVLGFVGKAVTFDSGGISLKPGAKMAEMKFDMSGGAAVIEAVAAIARLELPVRLVAVVGATENLPSGRVGQAGRHRHGRQRQDDRGQQHRRRGTARARRLPVPRRRPGRRADRRPGHADRRGDRRARLDLRRADGQRRRAGASGSRRPASAPARSSGGCRCTRSTTS